MIQLDYIIEQFSQCAGLQYETADPKSPADVGLSAEIYGQRAGFSAVCNEAVKLAQRRGFYNLKGFVNGVLRNTARRLSQVKYPDEGH